MRLTVQTRLLLLVAWLPPVVSHAQVPTDILQATPTCVPGHVAVRFEPDYGPDPRYHPGDILPLRLTPTDLDDWPTTPSVVNWHSSITDSYFGTTDTLHTVVIPDPAPDTVEVFAWISEPEIRPECGYWITDDAWFRARRFDYNPTPSPTVSPTPSPSPTPDCTPAYCRDYVVSPLPGTMDAPLTIIIELSSGTLDGLFAYWSGYHPITQIDERKWLAENLKPDTIYGMHVSCIDSCTKEPMAPSILFKTRSVPTPTPAPTPTPPGASTGWFVHGEDGATTDPAGDPASHAPLSRPDSPTILDQLLSILGVFQ